MKHSAKKIIPFFLALLIFASVFSPAFAADGSIAVAVVGADLTDEQVALVYQSFGFQRGAVSELIMTNELERKYLEGQVDSDVIGTRSVSCVYVEIRPEGSGLDVRTTDNITYFTPEMYASALQTAGIRDAKVVVDAPFQVSGTGALAGIYYAYETLTGLGMNAQSISTSTEELTVTGELAGDIGEADATDIVSDIKDVLGETADLTDEQLKELILGICSRYNVSLSDSRLSKLISLCRSLEKLSETGLLDKVENVQETLDRVSGATSKVVGFFKTVGDIIRAIVDFFGKIKDIFS